MKRFSPMLKQTKSIDLKSLWMKQIYFLQAHYWNHSFHSQNQRGVAVSNMMWGIETLLKGFIMPACMPCSNRHIAYINETTSYKTVWIWGATSLVSSLHFSDIYVASLAQSSYSIQSWLRYSQSYKKCFKSSLTSYYSPLSYCYLWPAPVLQDWRILWGWSGRHGRAHMASPTLTAQRSTGEVWCGGRTRE